MWWLLLGALAAGVPEDSEADPPPNDGASIEVIVYGELLVEQARTEVYADLSDAGYTEYTRKDDKAIFRHPDPWKGEVHVYDDGWIRIKRQNLQIEGREMPWADKNSPVAWAGCVIWLPLCLRPGGQTVAKRKFMHHETSVTNQVQPDVQDWGERIADLSTSRKVETLPDRLQGLWDDGTPLVEGDPTLTTATSRRAAIMAYWGSRTDTPWGEMVRASIEAFCRGVVEDSDTPFTEAEIASFNDQSTAGRPFDLRRTVAEAQ